MIAAIRYVLSMFFCTIWHASRVILAAARGERQQPGGIYDRIPTEYCRDLLRINRITTRAVGLSHLDGLGPVVFVADHKSWFDVPALVDVLPGSLRFVAKKELGRVPLFGQALRAAGHIEVDRHDPASAHLAYEKAARAIKGGLSAVVFGEGTRSRDGRLHQLKKGPFVLAIAAQVPVVPVHVEGSGRVLPKGSIRPHPGLITVHVGAPIPTAGLTYDDRDALALRTREALVGLGAHPSSDRTAL